MSYSTQADLADDGHMRRRVVACAASEGISNPESWASEQRWALSASPGWVSAYASALAAEKERPGDDEAVISDGMILAAVQALRSGT